MPTYYPAVEPSVPGTPSGVLFSGMLPGNDWLLRTDATARWAPAPGVEGPSLASEAMADQLSVISFSVAW